MPTAVITGATKGIGRAIAEKLLREGFDVAVCARSTNNLRDLHRIKSG
jgi:short-subunit dehydrogenase